MAPEIPGTGVFMLGSTLGLSFPHDSGLDPLDLGGIQSCFVVSGSVAEARNLHQRGKAGAQTACGSEGAIFVHSGLGGSVHNTSAGIYAPVGTHPTIDTGDHAFIDHGWGGQDVDQTGFQGAIEDR
jgi:hypothetical protein